MAPLSRPHIATAALALTLGATTLLGGCVVVSPRHHFRPVVVEPYRAPVVVEPYRAPRRYGYDRY